jgi:DNA-binding GntR family transcriptional regulator
MDKMLLKDQAYDTLKAMILDGKFKTGAFLSERALAIQLGMSKTPIRTALERLEQERFITISPQQGVVVREISLEEMRDHYEIRIALEGFVVQRLANRLSAAQFALLEANLDTMRRQVESDNRSYAMYADADFHLLLGGFHGNQEIVRVMRHQREKLYRVVMKLQESHPDRIRHSLDEHRAVVEALKQGDGELAASAMLKHLNNGRQLLIAF